MKHFLIMLLSLMVATSCSANSYDEPQPEEPSGEYLNEKKVLFAYFSWGGATRRMAESIHQIVGGDLFEIVPVVPYPSEYTPCTEVALKERDDDACPAIKDKVANWDDYDIIFIGCPVWWHTAPMIISTFTESYDFSDKTVVPFYTYTYRDETLQKIVDLTPSAQHLEGLGTTGSTGGIQTWINLINEQYLNLKPNDDVTPASGKVELYQKGNIPTVTNMGYQCFAVNYRIGPYTMQESATDLQRAIRYVRAHAKDYRINPENIALVGFLAGGILNGEVLLNWRDLKNGTALDSSYIPDELDEIPVSACAVGMIYSFYGRLSVSMNNVETLRAANLPPAFYCWGIRDGFAGQFTQNANAVEQAGCKVERKILQNYPHGYGTGGNSSVWGTDFDAFLTPLMAENTTATKTVSEESANVPTIFI